MEIIKKNEVMQYQFYSVPKIFFIDEKYKKISLEAKIIYAFLLDRLSLSQKNNWFNEQEQVYLIFKRKEISELLGISAKTTINAIKELKECDLLYEERQGLRKT